MANRRELFGCCPTGFLSSVMHSHCDWLLWNIDHYC
jgi:hypothetical protein